MADADLKRLETEGRVRMGRTVGEALAAITEEAGMRPSPSAGEPGQGAAPAATGAAFTCTLPYPPSVNSYWRHIVFLSAGTMAALAALFQGRPKYQAVAAVLSRCIRVLVSERGRDFRLAVKHVIRGESPRRGPLSVELILHPPDHRRRDLDNALKATLDAMQHAGVYYDDSQIRRLLIEWGRRVPGGSVDVRVQPLPEPQPGLWSASTEASAGEADRS